ncbi:hypothetical protein GCM10027028_01090 [Streptomyces sundarbansensis]
MPMVMGFSSAESVGGNWQPPVSRRARNPATIPGRMKVMEVLMLPLFMGMATMRRWGNLVTQRARFYPWA